MSPVFSALPARWLHLPTAASSQMCERSVCDRSDGLSCDRGMPCVDGYHMPGRTVCGVGHRLHGGHEPVDEGSEWVSVSHAGAVLERGVCGDVERVSVAELMPAGPPAPMWEWRVLRHARGVPGCYSYLSERAGALS